MNPNFEIPTQVNGFHWPMETLSDWAKYFENRYKCHSALRGAGYDQMMMDPETKKIKELFMERPIWSRHALIERSGIWAANLKKILPYIAFYWSTGPWKRMWHRLEPVFDPRIEKILGRRLQTVDIRKVSLDGKSPWSLGWIPRFFGYWSFSLKMTTLCKDHKIPENSPSTIHGFPGIANLDWTNLDWKITKILFKIPREIQESNLTVIFVVVLLKWWIEAKNMDIENFSVFTLSIVCSISNHLKWNLS